MLSTSTIEQTMTSQKDEIKKRLDELEKKSQEIEREKNELEFKLADIKRKEKGDHIVFNLKESKEHILYVLEKKDNIARYILSIGKELERIGIEINTQGLNYTYTIERTGRNGLDYVFWSVVEDCDHCPDKDDGNPTVHGVSFKGKEIPKSVKKIVQVHEDDNSPIIYGKWDHGSEFERAHVVMDSLVGIAKRETWKCIRDAVKDDE